MRRAPLLLLLTVTLVGLSWPQLGNADLSPGPGPSLRRPRPVPIDLRRLERERLQRRAQGSASSSAAAPPPSASAAASATAELHRLQQQHRQLAALRAERAQLRRAQLRQRFGARLLRRPEVKAELELHARRSAKLSRMADLAKEAGRQELLTRVAELERREAARHEKIMQAFQADGGQP